MSLPVALGLFTVRDLYAEDFDACLQKTAALGFAGVECFGKPTLPAAEVAASLKKHGLTLVGWHLLIDLLEGNAAAETIAYLKEVGCSRAVVPYMTPETFETRAGIAAFAARLNAVKATLAPHDIELGYHNHEAEFIPLPDGTLPWSVLMDLTGIFGQLDAGNALHSKTPGISPAELIGCWPGRASTIHAKPYSHTTGMMTMIGQDDIDWSAFLYACEHTGGTKWIIVEYEEPDLGQFEAAAECIHALEKFN